MNMLERIGIGKVDNGEDRGTTKNAMVVNAHDPERKEKVRITNYMNLKDLIK